VYRVHDYEDHLPAETGDRAALKAALEDLKGKDQIVQALKSPSVNGYEVVNVERDTSRNHYVNNFSAWVHDGVISTGYGYCDTGKLQEKFIYCKGLLAPHAVSESLKSIALKLGAVVVYPGTFWMPQDKLGHWQWLSEDMEKLAEGNRIRQMTTVMDSHTAREVRDALQAEIVAAAAQLTEDIVGKQLGEKALENRKDAAMAMHRRVKEYEEVLEESLSNLHQVIDTIEQAATIATLQTVGM